MAGRLLKQRGRDVRVELEGQDHNGAPATHKANGEVVLRRDAIDALRAHKWPGNFRELEVVVERALLLYGDGAQVTAADVQRALERVP
jgi:transcriptional regulator with PAS, ATPase and Fis domain